MMFCMSHWEALRTALEDRGLTVFSESGREAMTKIMRQTQGEDTIDTFEPLMEAHNIILANVMEAISRGGGNPLYLFDTDPEPPIEGREGQTWSRCPVCYVNLAHEISCKGCDLPQKNGFDWMINRAADNTLEHWEALKL